MIGQIKLNENERLQVGQYELTSGNIIKILILENAMPKWVEARVEHNGKEYYLTNSNGYSPIGLFANTEI